jgi:hypothetical protein
VNICHKEVKISRERLSCTPSSSWRGLPGGVCLHRSRPRPSILLLLTHPINESIAGAGWSTRREMEMSSAMTNWRWARSQPREPRGTPLNPVLQHRTWPASSSWGRQRLMRRTGRQGRSEAMEEGGTRRWEKLEEKERGQRGCSTALTNTKSYTTPPLHTHDQAI